MAVYTWYNTPPHTGVCCTKEQDRTDQQFLKDCSVRVQLEKLTKPMAMLPKAPRPPLSGDFRRRPCLQEILQTQIDMKNEFYALPKEIREACDNKPELWLRALNDAHPVLKQLLEKHGIIQAKDMPKKGAVPPALEKPPEPPKPPMK